MQNRVAITLVWLLTSMALGQTANSQFQPGTIMSVTRQQGSGSNDASIEHYDIDVKVGNTIYTVLVTQPAGKYGVQYRAGLELLVKVKEQSIVYNDSMGQTNEVPILSRRPVPQGNAQAVPESPPPPPKK